MGVVACAFTIENQVGKHNLPYERKLQSVISVPSFLNTYTRHVVQAKWSAVLRYVPS